MNKLNEIHKNIWIFFDDENINKKNIEIDLITPCKPKCRKISNDHDATPTFNSKLTMNIHEIDLEVNST